MLKKLSGLAIALVLPISAWSAEPAGARASGFFDVYYMPKSDLDISDGSSNTINSDGGKGYGLRASTPLGSNAFLQGEYQNNSYDGFEGFAAQTDATFLRIGLGITGDSGVYGLLEYIKQEIEIVDSSTDDTGYGLHVGIRSRSNDSFSFYGQVGYLDIGDFGTGMEFMLGAAFPLTSAVGLFADYRNTKEEDDSGAEGAFSDIRVGVRFKLGA